MTDLKCEAAGCRYNCGGLCGLDSIEVRGSEAHTRSATCCGSFAPGGNAEFAVDLDPRSGTEIECGACGCRYNDKGSCGRSDVEIDGSEACSCSDTCCGSFRTKRKK